VIDGDEVTGWFTEDFTLVELRTLRAIERLSTVRPENVAYNGLYPVPTLSQILDLARIPGHAPAPMGPPGGG
jgi:glycerophosphoryl diester phosphodiesterase